VLPTPPLLTQKPTSRSSFQAAPTLTKLTPILLGAMAALCAVPSHANPAWLNAQGVDTSFAVDVPAFRLQDNDVPTEWYSVPGLNFSTELELGE